MRPLPVYAIVWLVALAGFVTMAAFAAAHDTFPADVWLAHRLQDIDSSALAHLLDRTADFADLPLIALAALLAGIVFLAFAGRGPALLVIMSVPLERPLDIVTKQIVERPRPSAALVRVHDQPTDFSFPSGHVEAAVVLYGIIFYLATVHLRDVRLRLPLQVVSAWALILTCVQRVYVGDHWPSDVLGGIYLGLLMLAVLIAIDRLVIPKLRERNFPFLRAGLKKDAGR